VDVAVAAAISHIRNASGGEMKSQVAGLPGRRPAALNNKRTALVLLSIALAFFCGVIAKYWLLVTV
jgi:hypothetical protein